MAKPVIMLAAGGTGGHIFPALAVGEYLIARKKHNQKRNTELLTSTIEEYLSSFVLLGYNYDGDPVTLVSASTQQQSDSLGTLIQKFIVSQTPRGPEL